MSERISIPVPTIAPFGNRVTANTVREVWDTFVKPDQDTGTPQSVEMRALMGILRAVYEGMTMPTTDDKWAAEEHRDALKAELMARRVQAEQNQALADSETEEP